MLIEIHTFSLTKIRLKMSSGKLRLFCLGLNVLKRMFDLAFSLHVVSSNIEIKQRENLVLHYSFGILAFY